MILIERRRELGYSQDKVSRLSGLPRTLVINLECGVRSLKLLPFYQTAALCNVLDISIDTWYTAVCCEDYDSWLRKRRVDNGRY